MKTPKSQVYWNRHRKMWSVRSDATRRVTGYAKYLILAGCEFRVSESGRRRAVASGKRNVHAVVRGTPLSSRARPPKARECSVAVVYSPFRDTHFTDPATAKHVVRSRYVIFFPDGSARAVDPEFIL